jgi:hypothetical protein
VRLCAPLHEAAACSGEHSGGAAPAGAGVAPRDCMVAVCRRLKVKSCARGPQKAGQNRHASYGNRHAASYAHPWLDHKNHTAKTPCSTLKYKSVSSQLTRGREAGWRPGDHGLEPIRRGQLNSTYYQAGEADFDGNALPGHDVEQALWRAKKHNVTYNLSERLLLRALHLRRGAHRVRGAEQLPLSTIVAECSRGRRWHSAAKQPRDHRTKRCAQGRRLADSHVS